MESTPQETALGTVADAGGLATPKETSAERKLPHVVILGAGFAGLQVAKTLRGKPVRVTVIDRHNYHLFQPLLYQVATAALEPADIAGPIRQIVRGDNIETIMGEVQSVDPIARSVHLVDRDLSYDHLVIATGSTHSYFGHDEWSDHARGLKTLEDAVELRRRILYAFEAAERSADPALQRQWLTFVVVGGGPTGVELAGALAEFSRQTRARDFDRIDPAQARVLLLEGLPRVLSAYPEQLSERAKQALEKLGVEVRLNTLVTGISEDTVTAGDQQIKARTVLWGAGVAASPVARSLGVQLDRAGRVQVTPELSVPGFDHVYVLGDLAAFKQDGKLLPGLAPVAMAQGKHAASNILRAVSGAAREPFYYRDRGSFAVIGRGAAVGNLFNRWQWSGYPAWVAWLGIHIVFLMGFRNRIAVLFNWAYVYLTRRRHAQLLIGQAPGRSASDTAPFRDARSQLKSFDNAKQAGQAQEPRVATG